jgi:hypothetical protein
MLVPHCRVVWAVTELSGLDRLGPPQSALPEPSSPPPTNGARSSPDLVGEPLSRA